MHGRHGLAPENKKIITGTFECASLDSLLECSTHINSEQNATNEKFDKNQICIYSGKMFENKTVDSSMQLREIKLDEEHAL
jgi:hypothetical protein